MGGAHRPAATHGGGHAGLRLRCPSQFAALLSDPRQARTGRSHRPHTHPSRLIGGHPVFKTILLPVDLGEVEAAKSATDKAVAIARGAGGSVRLIYVRSIVPVTYMEFMPPAFDELQQEEAEKGL